MCLSKWGDSRYVELVNIARRVITVRSAGARFADILRRFLRPIRPLPPLLAPSPLRILPRILCHPVPLAHPPPTSGFVSYAAILAAVDMAVLMLRNIIS